jgi:Eukaryotic elongation factor 5A hypusine, DNA-binding OB fold
MSDDGETKDDVKVPEGEVGEKIEKLFHTEEKDTSESLRSYNRSRKSLRCPLNRCYCPYCYGRAGCHRSQRSPPQIDLLDYFILEISVLC